MKWQTIASWASVVVAAIAVVFLIYELREMRKTSNATNRILKQSYRPIGFPRTGEDPHDVNIGYNRGRAKNLFNFGFQVRLTNKGVGPLVYIGSFSYLSESPKNLRDGFLKGDIDSVVFDKVYNELRGKTILPGDFFEWTRVEWEDKEFKPVYYSYTVFLYEDQDGNLYDTEYCLRLEFREPKFKNETLVPDFVKERVWQKDVLHSYSDIERGLLIKRIRDLKHPMADAV